MSNKKTSEKTEKDIETKAETEETVEEVAEEQVASKDDFQDMYTRLFAEFDNYKKRTQKESLMSYGNGVSDTATKLLDIIDNFERAINAIDDSDKSPLAEGVKMIYKQFCEMFDALGVKEIPALGEKFDPNVHNAVMHIDDDSFGESEIVEVFMKGYKYKDQKVLRHSMVKVANWWRLKIKININ